MEILNWILAMLGGITAIVAAVCLAIAVVFRNTLTAWLTKRVAKGLERDAERYKHDLSRDMETYKNELARAQSTERLEAEMRKAVAEKMLTLRLDAFHDLYALVQETPYLIIRSRERVQESRFGLDDEIDGVIAMADALRRHRLYVDDEFAKAYEDLTSELAEIVKEPDWREAPPLPTDGRLSQRVRLRAMLCRRLLEEMHRNLPHQLARLVVPKGESGVGNAEESTSA
ncbi:hypothetical protein [Paraburkholderia sp. GAS32]|uniref:hypothetical protein n=1 Tax=Paraburkholderia sp. GAS32 TaxID=3035129 RepID=UPI003D2565F3